MDEEQEEGVDYDAMLGEYAREMYGEVGEDDGFAFPDLDDGSAESYNDEQQDDEVEGRGTDDWLEYDPKRAEDYIF